MADPLFDPNANLPSDDDIIGPINWDDEFTGDATANLPPAVVLVLQILFYAMLAFILLYLVSHWIFHSWSFVNIYRMGDAKRKAVNASWSDKATPALVVVMFTLYTLYMGSFVYVIVNMIAAIIKLTTDWLYTRKVRNDFTERKDEFLRSQGLLPASGSSSSATDLAHGPVHSPAASPDAAEKGLPLVYVLIPTYNEPLPNLMGAINGVAGSDYPRLRVYIGFDNYDVEQQFFTLCRLMTGVPLRSETLARRVAEDSAARAAAANNQDSPAFGPMSPPTPGTTASAADLAGGYSPKVLMGRKSQKYNGFDQIVTGGTGSIRGSVDHHRRDSFFADPGEAASGDLASLGAAHLYEDASTSGGGSTPSLRLHAPRGPQPLDFTAEDCPDAYTLEYRSTQITVCRFEHSGKLGTQRNMFERLQQELENEGHVEDPYILFMDSDTAIMPDTVSQLVAEVQRRPQTRAVTGMVVSRNEDCYNFWRIMQDAEYIESMIFRNAEALMGAVTCLPGVLTMFKYPVLLDVAQDYFYQREIASTFDFAQRYLGEDRYMTHLLMERPGTYTLGFNSQAMCKTEAPSNFNNLLRQRRRWFLGTITNELIMLCTPLFWRKYPLLMLTKFFQILKVGGAITYILLVELLFNLIFDYSTFKWDYLVWLLIVIIPNWLFVTVWAVLEKRLKAVLVFPAYYFFNPFFTIAILMYSFLTVRQRTWGGPRAAAATGDDDEDAAGDEDDVGAIRRDGAPLETVVVVEDPQIAPAADGR
ncbi:hypothetical protein H9P43_006379 [Blastocladiella emersonii ATCC 22665]|nr:hypothetical protein H9P43_006379 [Blastocladiella emersonii ATCC 22665]